ncbi:TraB/GumN family protein [Vibrio sp. WXL210]|uniref:TraB/GumN family protein n=1 Tax=Vibrio sp. WXL210 TaxID=3450709 RepID=UPI003EC66B4C
MLKQPLAALLLFITGFACAEPLYWQATKGNLSYTLVGSVHVGKPSMYPLPAALVDKLAKSDGLIIETNTSDSRGVNYPRATDKAKDHLSQAQLKELKSIAQASGSNFEQLLMQPPWSVAMNLQMHQLNQLGYQPEYGVDLHFMQQAIEHSIPIYALESLQFQINLISGQPNGGAEMLISLLDEYPHIEQITSCLLKSWQQGDEQQLDTFAQLSDMSPELEQAFIHQRNQAWADILDQRAPLEGQSQPIQTGNYVVVVGSLHLIGKDNVRKLLEKRGFSIEQSSTSGVAACNFL